MSTLVEKVDQADAAAGFKDIPIMKTKVILVSDLADIFNDDPGVQQALAAEIREACINVGFFYVRNHGIPEATINAALKVAKEFFALPLEAKMKIENKNTSNFKGYSPLLSGNNNPENAGDLQEGFEFGWETMHPVTLDNDEKSGVMAGENVWPSELPELREKALEY
ncbi:hypothetical protein C0992_000399 [Termitomyces sp. T32_za158]|nr:hypothetical protein C0992_000399 [Termitomyces sp. T32_za158]